MLHKLMSRVHVEASRAACERYAAIARVLRVPAWSVGFYLNKLHGYSLSMDSRELSLTAQITRLIRQVRSASEAGFIHCSARLHTCAHVLHAC